MKRALPVVFIGGGFAARSIWGPRVLSSETFRLRAVADPSPAARNYWCSVLGPDAVFCSHDSVPAEDSCFAFILSPNALHVSHAGWFLKRGIPALVEKPVCLTESQLDALEAAGTERTVACIPSRVTLFRRDVMELLHLVRSGRCGKVRHVEASWIRARGIPNAEGWRAQANHLGGGVLLDLGWHLLDVSLEILGDVRPVAGLSTGSSDFMESGAVADWIDRPAATVGGSGGAEDTFRGFLLTDSGASLALTAAWASHRAMDETRLTVLGSGGEVSLTTTFGLSSNRIDGSKLELRAFGEDLVIQTFSRPIGEEYDLFLTALRQRLETGSNPIADDWLVTRRVVCALTHLALR